jgi:hypothetical protein
MKPNQPHPGEIPLKLYLSNYAALLRCSAATAFVRWRSGDLKPKRIRRVNRRVIFVVP